MSALINGRDIASASAEHPVALDPGKPLTVLVELSNGTARPVTIHRVALRGTVLGLAFFTYDSSVDFTVAPESTGVVSYPLDLAELGGQANGLIAAELSAIDASGQPIATVRTVTDVRGSLWSVYGFFGIALIALTVLALVDVGLAVRRHALPTNRWRRGLRLLAPGVGIGLIMAFTTSVLRVWLPTTERWLLIASVTAAVMFALGYLAPTPQFEDDRDDDYDDYDDYDDEIAGLDADDEEAHTEATLGRVVVEGAAR